MKELVDNTIKGTKTEYEESVINIGALRDPRDLLADVDLEMIEDAAAKKLIIDYLSSGESKGAMAYRDKSGLETTPQLLIYRVDKNSKSNGSSRVDLNAPEDLIGLCLYIPGGRIGTSYASTVSIKMKNDLFDGDADLEDADAD